MRRKRELVKVLFGVLLIKMKRGRKKEKGVGEERWLFLLEKEIGIRKRGNIKI